MQRRANLKPSKKKIQTKPSITQPQTSKSNTKRQEITPETENWAYFVTRAIKQLLSKQTSFLAMSTSTEAQK
jgi:hypothetical protein